MDSLALYLVMVDDWNPNLVHPRQYGFDASYEIPSNLIPKQVLSDDLDFLELREDFTGRSSTIPSSQAITSDALSRTTSALEP